MSAEKTHRGGAGRGQGRKPIKAGEETVTVSLRMTAAQREKLAHIGGAEWVRGNIDAAKENNTGANKEYRSTAEIKKAPKGA